jgi:hypothetical protein
VDFDGSPTTGQDEAADVYCLVASLRQYDWMVDPADGGHNFWMGSTGLNNGAMHKIKISGVDSHGRNLHSKVFEAVQQQLATRNIDARWIPR